ncbi:hypothetical protein ElyMa_000283900 [Elysia marginata]|uniref:SCP domain-containing protein n=1 Tax=Elysia marginata TaxID=1093978 RepID=A0AAV4F7C7_9GAST|nr:hypothetical protein ElyMa_000283900 [Elysia marginata]
MAWLLLDLTDSSSTSETCLVFNWSNQKTRVESCPLLSAYRLGLLDVARPSNWETPSLRLKQHMNGCVSYVKILQEAFLLLVGVALSYGGYHTSKCYRYEDITAKYKMRHDKSLYPTTEINLVLDRSYPYMKNMFYEDEHPTHNRNCQQCGYHGGVVSKCVEDFQYRYVWAYCTQTVVTPDPHPHPHPKPEPEPEPKPVLPPISHWHNTPNLFTPIEQYQPRTFVAQVFIIL